METWENHELWKWPLKNHGKIIEFRSSALTKFSMIKYWRRWLQIYCNKKNVRGAFIPFFLPPHSDIISFEAICSDITLHIRTRFISRNWILVKLVIEFCENTSWHSHGLSFYKMRITLKNLLKNWINKCFKKITLLKNWMCSSEIFLRIREFSKFILKSASTFWTFNI